MVQRGAGDDRIDPQAGLVLLELALFVVRLVGRVRVDADRVVARRRERGLDEPPGAGEPVLV
jgi:hypothetical protein